MTELEMGLLGLGGTVVVGVLAFNKWQEYRQRKLAEAVFKPQQQDVLLDRNAPVIGAETAGDAVHSARLEPMMAEPQEAAVPAFDPELLLDNAEVSSEMAASFGDEVDPGEVPAALLDSRFEFIVAMELVDPVPVDQILASQRATLHRLGKPVHWVGFCDRTREWVRLSHESDFAVRRLRVGLQLVDRRGPILEGDVVSFTNAMHALAEELMAVAVMPPSQVLDQAAEIDRFCAAVDIEIGLNLVSRGTLFPGTKIRALAEAAGMDLGEEGVFVRHDEAGCIQFSVQNFENTPFSTDTLRTITTHGLTFLIDVPCVEHGERVFGQMLEVARRFADTLQGELVDDNRQPLSDAQLDHIRREFIGRPQAKMASYGLSAGSPQALRLFS